MQVQKNDNQEVRKTILKAQEQVIAFEMNRRFKKNMHAFRRLCPILFRRFKNYQPKKKQVFVDPLGFVNLGDNGIAVYNGDPKRDSELQMELFEYQPKSFDMLLARCNDSAAVERFAHVRFVEKLADLEDKYLQLSREKITFNDKIVPESINMLMMVGLGLGYQLQKLCETHDVRNLFIYEPDTDVFYATLFTIDWEPILKKASAFPYGLNLSIGGKIEEFCAGIEQTFDRIGVFNIAKVYLYKHLNSTAIDDAFMQVVKYAKDFYEGWGFLEDEVISISHTIHNLTHDPMVYNNKAKIKEEYLNLPIILIGNGPSLDANAERLKVLQDKAIIVCCAASTLSSLARYGIRPDFLAVMERTRGVMDWVNEVSDEEFRRSIRFISINHTHPDVGNSFGKWGVALKTFDTGARFIADFFDNPQDSILEYSANTGANTAVSVFGELGFKRCYLFGVDLGYKDRKKHHSQQSSYYDQETGKDLDRYFTGGLERKANFGGVVYTERVMDTSRRMFEYSLRKNKKIICYNCSDGVFIEGSKTFEPEHLNLIDVIPDKSAICDEILETAFPLKLKIDQDALTSKVTKFIDDFLELCDGLTQLLEDPVDSGAEMILLFRRQYELLSGWGEVCQKHERGYGSNVRYYTVMLGGSLCHLQTQASHMVLSYSNWVSFETMWKEIKPLFAQYLDMCKQVMVNDYNKLDGFSHFKYEEKVKLEKETSNNLQD